MAALEGLKPDDGFSPGALTNFQRTYHCSFLDTSHDYRRQTTDLLCNAFTSHIARYLNGYEILNCNFYIKPPGTKEFPLHQNWPTIGDLNDTTVTVWCPLMDVVESNGTLQFVIGSHKLLPHIEGPNVPGFFRDIRQAVVDKYLTPIPVNAGEALIFDDALIHWSAPNESDHARIAIQILCVPADAHPVYFFFDPAFPDRFEKIAVDREFFIETNASDLIKRNPAWRSLGFVPNHNAYPTESEFASLLAHGNEIRKKVYASRQPSHIPLPNRTNWITRVKSYLFLQ